MKIRWLVAGYDRKPGDILEVSDDQGESLIAHGFAEFVEEAGEASKKGGRDK